MTDRIAHAFSKAREEKRACFVAYLCAGDPDFETSLAGCRALIEGGIDILELGVPFSDPLADGLTNQLAAQRALESGMTQEQVFELVREIRTFSEIPIVFYTYYNLMFSQGEREYVAKAKAAGVDGLLTLDLPPEEAETLLEICKEEAVKNIFIVAPTTPAERVSQIAEVASGFLYYVSRTGVTGARSDLPSDLVEAVSGIKSKTELPVVVGFGVSAPEHVQAISAVADGVVVGSSLVNCLAENMGDKQASVDALSAKMAFLLS